MALRILLINPPYPFEEVSSPPLGLIALGTFIRSRGHRIRIEDFVVNRYSPERLEQIIKSYRPDIAGATAVTMNVKSALKILNDVKKINPGIATVLGGPHVTFDAENTMKGSPFLDYAIRGEGEITFEELCEIQEKGRSPETVPGLSFRTSNQIAHNDERPFIQDIDSLPIPDRSLAELGKYRGVGLTLSMVTSRGCPHQCIFCVGSRMVGRKVRYFSTERVVDEFQMLASMGFGQVNIADDLFTSNRKRCRDICAEIIRRDIRQPWSAFARVDTVTEDLLDSLREAGCRDLCFGMESGNQEILDTCKKRITLEQSRNAVDLCRKGGVRAMASFILGLPGETPDTVEQTKAFASSLGVPYGYHILAPFPGSEVRERREDFGITVITDDWDLYDANRAVCRYPGIDHHDMETMHDDFYKSIYTALDEKVKLYDSGGSLEDVHVSIVRGFKNAQFVFSLFSDELLEKYPGIEIIEDAHLRDDLVRYLANEMKRDKSFIAQQVDRLVREGSIHPEWDGRKYTYRWAGPAYGRV